MRFYRLEKKNYFTFWCGVVLKSIGLSLLVVVALMLICGFKFMIVSSGSMEPTLPVGSLVIVTPCDYEDLKLNDIVTMNAGGIYLTHRVVGKMDLQGNIINEGEEGYEEAYWYTKGDNSDTIDGRLTKEVVGVVQESHCFTWVGDVVMYVKSNYIMLIILAIIFVVFYQVLEYLKNKLIEDDVECYETEEDEE